MFGLNVSMWLAPPPRKTTTTAASLTYSGPMAARAFNNHGNDSPPTASDPARRKSRRVRPEQSRAAESEWRVSMAGARRESGGSGYEDTRAGGIGIAGLIEDILTS